MRRYCKDCKHYRLVKIPGGMGYATSNVCVYGEERVDYCVSPHNMDPIDPEPINIANRINSKVMMPNVIYSSCHTCRRAQALQPSCGPDADWYESV